MVKRQGKAGIAVGRSKIKIPVNSSVISGVRCAEGEEKGEGGSDAWGRRVRGGVHATSGGAGRWACGLGR